MFDFDDRNYYRCNKTMCHRTDCLDCYPRQTTEKEEKDKESARRKATPVFSGFCRYFPLAMQEVSRLSKIGNDKHSPGEPLHWAKEKANDHGDCLLRHQLEFDEIDPDTGMYHAVAVAWRAMAQLETLLEAE